MRNFANYDVDIHGKSSGVLKTICKKCLPTRKNKRDRSLRVNVDTGHCHCYHCGADFYVPDDVEERKNAEHVAARKRLYFLARHVRCAGRYGRRQIRPYRQPHPEPVSGSARLAIWLRALHCAGSNEPCADYPLLQGFAVAGRRG